MNSGLHCSTRYDVKRLFHQLFFMIAATLIGILALEIKYVVLKDRDTELMPANPPFVVAVAIKQSDNLQELNRVLNSTFRILRRMAEGVCKSLQEGCGDLDHLRARPGHA